MTVEPDGYRAFVEQNSTRLLRTAWLLTGNWVAAEDLVQEALVRAWPKWSVIECFDHPAAYVSKIVVNVYLNGRRRTPMPAILADDMASPGDPLTQQDDRHALVAALRRLPPRQRAVIALRYLADLSEGQAAEAMSCTVGTVKSTTAKALRALRGMPELAGLGPAEVRDD